MPPRLDPPARGRSRVASYGGARAVVGVCEIRRVVVGANIRAGENNSVAPLEHISPPIFNIAVLDRDVSVRARGAARVVGHGVGSARIDNGAGVHVSAPDLGLSVPVRELDEVEIPKRELQGEIRLIISGSEGLNPAPERGEGGIHFRRLARPGLIGGIALVAANIDDVALSDAVTAVSVGRGDLETVCRLVCDLHLKGRVRHLYPKFRDFYEGVISVRYLCHARPREAVIKGRAPGPGSHRGDGISKEGRVVRPGEGRRARAVPGDAVNTDKGRRHVASLIRGGVVVGARGDLDRDNRGATLLIDTGNRDFRPAHADGCDAGITGLGGDRTVTRPRDGDRPGRVRAVQREGGRGNAQTARGLADSPVYGLRRRGSVAPLIVRGRSKGRGVGSGVRGRRRPAERQLCRIVVVPVRRERGARIGEAPALARDCGDHCTGDGDGRCHRRRDAVFRIFHGDALTPEGGKGRGARRVARYRRRAPVCIGGLYDHSRRGKRLSVAIRRLCGRRGDCNRDEFRDHGHGLGGCDALSALGISDRDTRHAVQ